MKQKAKRGAKGMRYSLFVSVLIILNVVCQSSDILPTQSQEIHLETLQELDNELKEEENIVNESSDELDESTDPQEIVEETLEEIEILKFNINGLKLREGIISEDVLRLKEFLKAMGYEGIIEDYKYDQKTKVIVMDYQRANGLVPDGVVGEKTFTKINEDMEINKIFIPEKKIIFSMDEDQVNEEIPEGNFIIINKDSNTLYHLSNREIIDKYPVATGKELKYTPEGKFTIVTKFVNPAWGGAGRYKPIKGGDPNNPLGTRWMGLNIRGGGVYGIHGNSDENSIGRYVSLGCVRMFNEDVEALYDLIDYGTPVWIGTEEKLGEYGIRFIYE